MAGIELNGGGGTTETGATIKTKLEALSAGSRLGIDYIDEGTAKILTADERTAIAGAVLMAGRATGQTIAGGTAASENLTLTSTNHATKGNIVLGSSSYYSETYDVLGLGVVPTGAANGKLWCNGHLWLNNGSSEVRLSVGSSFSWGGGLGGQAAGDTIVYGYKNDGGDYGIDFRTGSSHTSKMRINRTGSVDIAADTRTQSIICDGDIGNGISSTNIITGVTDTPTSDPGWASSSTVDMTAPDGYIKAYVGTQAVVVPYWNT